MKKSKAILFALLLMSFCASASDTTLVLFTPVGNVMLKIPSENIDSTINALVEELAKLANDGVAIGEIVSEKKPQSIPGWIALILSSLLPILTSFVVRFTRTIRSISSYFKDNSTLAIVAAAAALLAAIYELVVNGYSDAFFNNWSALFSFAFAGSMSFYELVLKKYKGKTPKAVKN